jgi:hypothetical protein
LNNRLALFTFGVFAKPADDPANDGFHVRNDPILAAVPLAKGYIGHSGYPDEPGTDMWGEYVFPAFYEERGDGWTPQTLSLWREACARHLHLHEHGASEQVFTFKQPFSADGDPVDLNGKKVKQIAHRNATRLASIGKAG